MKRSSLARACYMLLLACFPASMLPIVWLSQGNQERLIEHAPRLHQWLFLHVYPFLPSWPQYFAVQTLAAALAVCGAALLLSRAAPQAVPRRRPHWVFPALVAAYAGWAGLSYFWSAWPYGTRAYFMRELPFYFLCVAAYLLCGRRRRWTTTAVVFAASALVEALAQWVVTFAQFRSGRIEPLPGRELTLRFVFLKRAIFYSNCNFASALVLTGAFITIALLAGRLLPHARPEGEAPPSAGTTALLLVCAAGALAVLGGILWTAGSLAGFIAAGTAGAAFVICLLPSRARLPLTATAVVIGLATMATVLTSDRLWTSTMRALLSPRRTTHLRVIDWLTAKELYVRKPLQGWGMGTFPATHAQFHPPLARKLPFLKDKQTTTPHNEFARIAADQGSVGLVLYLAVLAYAFVVSYRALQSEPLRMRLLGFALWAGVLTFVVQGAFGKAPVNWSFATNFWLLLGVLASARQWTEEPAEEADQAPLRIPVEGWLVLLVVAVAVGWYWWEWAARGYASMVTFHRAHVDQMRLHEAEGRTRRYETFVQNLEESRPRFLWPDSMLEADYSAGWFLTRQGRWAEAGRKLEQVQRTAPEFQKTRLFLAECYLNAGRTAEARMQLGEYLQRNPYDMEAYDLLARFDQEIALQALEAHVTSRLTRPGDWIVEDYPSAEEVQRLLRFYVAVDRMAQARELVERVRRFFADELPRPPFDVYREVRALEQRYREVRRDPLADRLRQALPEAWRSR